MNSQLTIQYLQNLTQAIATYLRLNDEYRRSRNPENKQNIKTARNKQYQVAQQQNAILHPHLLAFKEPDFLGTQARKLIELWDARNTCFENLINRSPDDHPRQAIERLDNAEKRLRTHIRTINEIISKIQQ